MKIDLRKAYDTINWDFIRLLMLALGFLKEFVDKVMKCVTTTRLIIAINMKCCYFFKVGRCLRQEDPISPLLFILVMDYPSRIIRLLISNSRFSFHPLYKKVNLAHLCFINDLLMFYR